MISMLRGTIAERGEDASVIDVNGVGYQVATPKGELGSAQVAENGAETTVWVQTVVREDAILLFGFSTRTRRDVFRTLTGVSGVGPKIALALLSDLSIDDIAAAIAQKNPKALTKASGVGNKLAERLVLELKDKLVAHPSLAAEARIEPVRREGDAMWDDVRSALVNLGYKPAQVERTLEAVRSGGRVSTFEAALREALVRVTSPAS